MTKIKFNLKFLLITTLFTMVITTLTIFVIFKYIHPTSSGDAIAAVSNENKTALPNKNERKIVYWKAPMDPTELYEQPGKSKMGMDLVPVYEDELISGVDIKIDPIVEQNMGLTTERVQKSLINHTIKTYGNITFDETRTGTVSQKVSGWIEKLYADYTGFHIKKGDPLYEIYSPALMASQEEYLSAYKNYTKNKSELNKELLSSTQQKLRYFDIAQSEINAIEKSGKVKKTLLVRSPFTGVITHKNILQGTFVKAGASLLTISDLNHLWVEAHIFEYEQNLVFKGQKVEMTLSYSPNKIYKGDIAYIFPYLQPKTRDIIVRIHFDNKDLQLKPDMFAKIQIKSESKTPTISIPSQAVIHSGKKKIVFIQKENKQFSPREIKTGTQLNNGKIEIISGLTEGERIVTSGQFLLDSESKMKEAIQKMIKSKSEDQNSNSEDDFFDDMAPEKDFFDDMG